MQPVLRTISQLIGVVLFLLAISLPWWMPLLTEWAKPKPVRIRFEPSYYVDPVKARRNLLLDSNK